MHFTVSPIGHPRGYVTTFVYLWCLWSARVGAMLSEQQSQLPLEPTEKQQDLEAKWGEDVSSTSTTEIFLLGPLVIDLTWSSNQWAFSGIATFGHLPHFKCLTHPQEPFDIGVVGAPFDTAVSYRPGTVPGLDMFCSFQVLSHWQVLEWDLEQSGQRQHDTWFQEASTRKQS